MTKILSQLLLTVGAKMILVLLLDEHNCFLAHLAFVLQRENDMPATLQTPMEKSWSPQNSEAGTLAHNSGPVHAED